MNRRRYRTLTTLERLQDKTLQARSAELTAMGSQRSALDEAESELERRRKTGTAIKDIEAMPYMGHFIQTMRRQTAQMAEQRQILDEKIAIKREEVREVWAERKKSRVLIDRMDQSQRTAEILAEQNEQDELTIIKFGRAISS